jgi:aquaporin Z
MSRELTAEFIGTFALVTAVCGAALFSAPSAGLMAVAFAVGLSVVAMAYAVGSISGGHFNPAVTCGLVAAGRFEAGKAIPYIIAQVIGGLAAAAIFYVILQGAPAAGKWNTFLAASNTYGGSGFSMLSAGLI